MKKRKKNIFKFVLFSNIAVFTTILYLSIPALFNYENLENLIENKFYKEFSVVLKIKDKISYKMLPKPHLFIKKATIDLNKNDAKSSITEINNLKIFIHAANIYSKSNIEIKSVEISKTNFNFSIKDIKDFRDHMFYKINKTVIINDSKFFYLDKKKNVILISPIDSLKYSVNFENKFKQLKIKGNIFDTKYQSVWEKNYDSPNKTFNEIKFKNPNLIITNNFNLNDNFNFSGNSLINFLNENISLNYKFDKNTIAINSSSDISKQKIKIFSNINLDPFYFDTKIIMAEQNYKFLINYFFNYLFNIDKNVLENINGKLTLYFADLNNEIINSGRIDLILEEKLIKIISSKFKIDDVGIINSNIKYYEKEGELLFNSSNELKIEDHLEFARKFQLDFDQVKKINKIFFDLEKEINKDEFFISNIYINKINKNKKSEKIYNIKNIQTLKSLLRSLIS